MIRIVCALFVVISLIATRNAAAAPILFVAQASKPTEKTSSSTALQVRPYVYSGGRYIGGKAITPFPKSFSGGLRIAVADIDGDLTPELVVAPGPGSVGPRVKIFDIETGTGAISKAALLNFFAFDQKFRGGVTVASGYFTPDFNTDLVFAGSKNSSEVKTYNAASSSVLLDFFAFDDNPKGGVNIATGDLSGDGFSDIVVAAGAGGYPRVSIFNGVTGQKLSKAVADFFAFDTSFKGGVNVAVGDINGDGARDVIVAPGKGGNPDVRVFSGIDGSKLMDFFAYPPAFKGGVYVTAGDVNGDGITDIITAPQSGKQPVKLFDGRTHSLITSFYPFGKKWTGGSVVYQF